MIELAQERAVAPRKFPPVAVGKDSETNWRDDLNYEGDEHRPEVPAAGGRVDKEPHPEGGEKYADQAGDTRVKNSRGDVAARDIRHNDGRGNGRGQRREKEDSEPNARPDRLRLDAFGGVFARRGG